MRELIIVGHNVNIRKPANKGLVISCDGQLTELDTYSGLEYLVVDRETGVTSAEAEHWLAETGVTYTSLWRDRGVMAASQLQPNMDLWHRQMTHDDPGIERRLLTLKLEGQASITETMLRDNRAAKLILDHRDELATAAGDLKVPEMIAARVYWQAWSRAVHAPWLADELLRVEADWITFPGRRSPNRADGNKNAADPVNAMLNLGYAALEALCIRACHATGLTPMIGISHHGKYDRKRHGLKARNSMAFDLMEPLRPEVDKIILGMLDYGQGIKPYMQTRDFLRTRRNGEFSDRNGQPIPVSTCRIQNKEIKVKIYQQVTGLQDLAVRQAKWVRSQL